MRGMPEHVAGGVHPPGFYSTRGSPGSPLRARRRAPVASSRYWSASGETTLCRVCRQRVEEEAELKAKEAARALEATGGDAPRASFQARAEYDVSFLDRGPLNMILEEMDVYKIVVKGSHGCPASSKKPRGRASVVGPRRAAPRRFTATEDGEVGFAESCGKISIEDELVGVNGISMERLKFGESIELVKSAEWPMALRFRRPAVGDPMLLFSNWSANALRHALLEADVDIGGLKGRSELVSAARKTFQDVPPSALPKKAPAPSVAGGVRAIFAGATSITGWLLVKFPGEPSHSRFFCKLVRRRRPSSGGRGLFRSFCLSSAESESLFESRRVVRARALRRSGEAESRPAEEGLGVDGWMA